MKSDMEFLFPYFGHAYSESDIVDLCIWFIRSPSEEDRKAIERMLTAGQVSWGVLNPWLTWDSHVIYYSETFDFERKWLRANDLIIAQALKQFDPKLYGVLRKDIRAKAVPFGINLVINQSLQAIHQKFPIAFAVRSQSGRDRTTAWHEWSLTQCIEVGNRIAQYVMNAPSDSFNNNTIAPWLHATTGFARAATKADVLKKLDIKTKKALKALFMKVEELHATFSPDWPDDDAVFRKIIAESRDALGEFSEKLLYQPKMFRSGEEALDQIEKEAKIFEFTQIFLKECPSVKVVKADEALRFEVVSSAIARQLKLLEQLSGNVPGETGMAFSTDDQQILQLREKLVSQLLLGKSVIGEVNAVAILNALAGTIRPLGGWLPYERIAQKLLEHIAKHGRSAAFSDSLQKLCRAQWPLNHPVPSEAKKMRAWFEALQVKT